MVEYRGARWFVAMFVLGLLHASAASFVLYCLAVAARLCGPLFLEDVVVEFPFPRRSAWAGCPQDKRCR